MCCITIARSSVFVYRVCFLLALVESVVSYTMDFRFVTKPKKIKKNRITRRGGGRTMYKYKDNVGGMAWCCWCS